MKRFPALDVHGRDTDLALAVLDDFHPTAVEEAADSFRVFFSRAGDRDAAQRVLATRYRVEALDVPDEDWARRSQDNLQPITIGALTIFPADPQSPIPNPYSLVIQPSMGFGTGHHATTQLCLEALQAIDLTGAQLLDVGTGSGVLAIAAVRLGASRAIGIDTDEDAIAAARENLTLNPGVANRVAFEVGDVDALPRSWRSASALRSPTIVTANLTGALLVRSAEALAGAVGAGGILILSGLQIHERDDVARAFAGTSCLWERTADEWVGMAVKKA